MGFPPRVVHVYWISKIILKLYEKEKIVSIFRAGCSINKTEHNQQPPSPQNA